MADMDLKTVTLKGDTAIITDGGGHKMVLQIGPFDAGLGANKGASLEMVGGAQAVFKQHPLKADQGLIERVQFAIEGNFLTAAILEIKLKMILQVFTDARQVVLNCDTGLIQYRGRSDTRYLQQLR